MKSEDVDFMFNEMVQRTEQLFFSPVESVDNRFLNLPSFLAALASIINEMDTVCVCWKWWGSLYPSWGALYPSWRGTIS